MLIFTVFNINMGNAQTILINQDLTNDTIMYPFTSTDKAYSFKISGSVILNSDTSLVRVILEDIDGKRLLIFETYSLISLNDTVTIASNCDETCFLEGTSPASLCIDIINASFRFDSLMLTLEPFENPIKLQNDFKFLNDSIKVSILNTNIINQNMYWRADRTHLTEWQYQKKEEFFGRRYNLLGFDYYKGGVFERINRNTYLEETSQYVSSFDWRNRHGANSPSSAYFDGDNQYFTGWMTPVEDQGTCGTCSIFGSTGAVEARLNLYFNIHDKINPHHLDYDISEQDVWKCGYGLNENISCSTGGFANQAYNRMKSEFRCTDNYYPYSITAADYCQKPGNPPGELKLSGYSGNILTPGSLDVFKAELIKHGPLTGLILSLNHYVVMVGYETGREGLKVYKRNSLEESDIILGMDSRLDGVTICYFKNSWGYNTSPNPNPVWGVDGFGMIVYEDLKSINYTVGALLLEGYDPNPNSASTDIICSDEDGDGYYWWGTSQETPCASCPYGISTFQDCDDSNRDLGPYDTSYGCTSNCESEAGTFAPPNNYLVNTNLHIKKDILINTGCTVTINSSLFMATGRKITIKKGGKLIIQSQGKITSSCNQLWQGIEIEGTSLAQSQNNQGVCLIYTGGIIENAVCGIKSLPENFQMESGAIINANGATFRNNITAVYLTKYNSSFDPSLTKFDNCLFETDGVLTDGSAPLALVRLDDLSNANCITFKGCTFSQSGNQRIATGIKAFNSFFKCINYNITPTSFENLLYGVYGSCSTSPSPVVIIDDCDFINNFKSIYLSALTAPQIIRNRINIPPNNSGFMPLEGFTAYGLYLDASTAYKVESNSFFCNTYTDQIPVYIKTCGVYIRNSGPYANEIYSNSFNSLNCGVAAFGVNRNGINEGLQIRCNTFSDCGTDVGVYRSGLPLTSNIGIRRDQGEYNTSDPSKSAGNVFTSLSFQHHVKDIDNSGGNYMRYNHHNRLSIPTEIRMVPDPILSPSVEIHQNSLSLYNFSLSCPSNLQNGLSSLSLLNNEADLIKEMVDSTSIVLQQNIDGGDTPGTVSLVANSPIEETFAVYNDLLSKSPFLSDTSMRIAVEREELLPSYMLRDILVANPHSAKSDSIVNALENRYIPLNDTLMGEIMANTSYIGAKEQIEISRAGLRQQWGKLRNNIIAQILSDTSQVKIDSIIWFYNKGNSLPDLFTLAFLYACDGNIESSEQIFEYINTSELDYNQLTELFLQQTLINFVNSVILQDTIFTPDSLQLSAIYQVITTDSAYNSTASVLIRNSLIKSGNLSFVEPLLFNTLQKSEKVRRLYPMIGNRKDNGYLKISPNPANDFVRIEYRLPQNCKKGLIIISEIDGTVINKIDVFANKDEIIFSLNDVKGHQIIISLIGCSASTSSIKLILR